MTLLKVFARGLGYAMIALSLMLLTVCWGGYDSNRSPSIQLLAAQAPPARQAEDFDSEVRGVRLLVERFWAEQFAAGRRTYVPVRGFGPYGPERPVTCAGKVWTTEENAFYCPGGDFIAYNYRWLKGYYDTIGDSSVYVIIPHEWGHAVQTRLGVSLPPGIQWELQADCLAGAFVGAAVRRGDLIPESGDAQEIFGQLAAGGDPTDEWWLPEAHGTADQRQKAFTTGVTKGLSAC